MTAPASTAALDAVAQMVYQLATNYGFAQQFAADGQGVVAAQGVNLEGADIPAAVAQACAMPGFPPEAAEALQSYTSGGGGGGGSYPQPAPHPQPVEHVVQQLQYVNYVTHEGDTTITQTILDQSTKVQFGDNANINGPITFDNDPVAALGEGSVAAGENSDVNAATGENSQAIDDSTIGNNANNSAGAVQAGEDINAPVNTGINSGVLAEDIDAPVVNGTNTGVINDDGVIDGPILSNSTNTGVVADGPVTDTIVGNDNDGSANDFGPESNAVLNFGEGDVNNVNESSLNNSSVGDNNASGNTLGQGSVVETGEGNASSNFNDNDTTTTTTENNSVSTGDNSIVTTEQGPGDNDSFDNSFQDNDTINADVNLPRTLEVERSELDGPDHGGDDDSGAAA
jgi:hypothetical protein